jgi:hypothetical protein
MYKKHPSGCFFHAQSSRATPKPPVGASLLAIAAGQLASILNVPASSRASSLPHWICGGHKSYAYPESPCGSELAHDSGGSACIDIECAGLFASKLAPTLDLRWAQILCLPQIPLWERACSRKRWVSLHPCPRCNPLWRGSLLPLGCAADPRSCGRCATEREQAPSPQCPPLGWVV